MSNAIAAIIVGIIFLTGGSPFAGAVAIGLGVAMAMGARQEEQDGLDSDGSL